jgi:adenylate kinase family enzyme
VRYQRIHVLGGPGSGKSYAAARIAATYAIEAHDLDELFWDRNARTYGVRADKEKRDHALAALVTRNAWVIEGVYYKWLAPSFDRAEVILIMTPSVWLRDWRITKRFVLRILGIVPTKKHETLVSFVQLLRWNHTYDRNELAPARAMIARMPRRVIECRTLADVLRALGEDT